MIRPSNFKTASPFCSIASFPSNFNIQGKNPDEHLLLVVRQHKIILVINILIQLFLLILPNFFLQILTYINKNFLQDFVPLNVIYESKWWTIFLIALFSYVLSNIFDVFYRWFYNLNILTTERFLDVDLESIFKSRIEVAALVDVQDVKDTQIGIFQSIFNIGDVTMLTASGGTIFNLQNIPEAHKVRDFIMDVSLIAKKLMNKND